MQYNCRIILDNRHYWRIRLTLEYVVWSHVCVCVHFFVAYIISIKTKYFNNNDIRLTFHSIYSHWMRALNLYFIVFCRLLSMLIIWNAVFGAPNSAPIFIEYKFILFKLIYVHHMLFLFGFLKWSIHSIRLNALSCNLGDTLQHLNRNSIASN